MYTIILYDKFLKREYKITIPDKHTYNENCRNPSLSNYSIGMIKRAIKYQHLENERRRLLEIEIIFNDGVILHNNSEYNFKDKTLDIASFQFSSKTYNYETKNNVTIYCYGE
jgi:hypothetical protein